MNDKKLDNIGEVSPEEAVELLSAALRQANSYNQELSRELESAMTEITTLMSQIEDLKSKINDIQNNVKSATLL